MQPGRRWRGSRLNGRTLTPEFVAALTKFLAGKQLLPYTRHVEFRHDTPLAEQIRAFARARLIIGNHGAGCVNVVFAPAKAIFVELEEVIFPCYQNMAERLGLRYIRASQRSEHRSRLFSHLREELAKQNRWL